MSTIRTTYDEPALAGKTIERDARALLGQVMGFVAVTVGFAALGAYLGRDLSGATGLVLFIGAFALIFGLNSAAAKGREQLAIGLLFGLGLVLGLAVAPDHRRLRQGGPVRSVAGDRSHGGVRRRPWRVRLRHPQGPLVVGTHVVLGAAGPDRVRHRRDLRLDPQREHHLRRRRARDLRRVHDLRLQPAAPSECRRRHTHRRKHLPRHLQCLPASAHPVRRPARLTPIVHLDAASRRSTARASGRGLAECRRFRRRLALRAADVPVRPARSPRAPSRSRSSTPAYARTS